MRMPNRIPELVTMVGTVVVLAACTDRPAGTPTGLVEREAVQQPAADIALQSLDPFTIRAPLASFHINRPPDFVIHSRETKDIVMQRSVFVPGPGGWHTHPGPTFVIVTQGLIKLTRYTQNDGCVDTEVFGPGQAYFETGADVHRATVLSAEDAVLLVMRFNIPVGGAITIPASDPGC